MLLNWKRLQKKPSQRPMSSHEAEVLIHLSQGPRLSNATFTAEAWDEVLEANPINKETILSFLLRPPEPKWSKAMHDATVRAWTDFGSLKDGTGEEGISKFCSRLPSCVGMYQGFHEHVFNHVMSAPCVISEHTISILKGHFPRAAFHG